jgi:hypothetical protein
MRIFEFERLDGTSDFDYTVPHGAKVLDKIVAKSEVKIKKIIHSTEGRLRALAERALTEEYPTPMPPPAPASFWGRFRWLFTGK